MLIVTATDLPRLMACNGSRLMTGHEKPVINADDTVKEEGNAAHWLVEQVQSGQFSTEELIDRKAPNGIFITAEMVEYLDAYLKSFKQDHVLEIETSFAGETWQINGRADRIRYDVDKQELYIDELKYGWSIVEPEDNWTLRAHVLGFIARNPDKPVRYAEMTIYQPRPYHPESPVRSRGIGYEEIARLYKELDQTLSNPSEVLNTSKHCKNCSAIAFCPAARKAQYNAIEASENAFVDTINNVQLSFQLDHIKRAGEMLKTLEKAYNELAVHRLRKGEFVENYSLQNEYTNRQWFDHVTPEFLQSMTGKDLTKKELITPAQAEKSGVPKEFVSAMTTRNSKGIKLVRIDVAKKAKKMFGEK